MNTWSADAGLLRASAVLVGWALAAACALAAAPQPGAPALFLEEMTSTELRAQIANGVTTVLVPIGGTEQNGPHMVLGKHNVRVRALAGQIARALGNTVVAPVLAYVPEGAVQPPQAHMRFAGTVSIPDAAFEATLEGIARSMRLHGLRDIVFLGDHGGYQKNEVRVATRLNREWARDGSAHVYALTEYYEVTQTDYVQWLKTQGFTLEQIGTHAGLADTALALAVDPALVRADLLTGQTKFSQADGVYGDPRKATAEAGRAGLQMVVERSVKALRSAMRNRTNP